MTFLSTFSAASYNGLQQVANNPILINQIIVPNDPVINSLFSGTFTQSSNSVQMDSSGNALFVSRYINSPVIGQGKIYYYNKNGNSYTSNISYPYIQANGSPREFPYSFSVNKTGNLLIAGSATADTYDGNSVVYVWDIDNANSSITNSANITDPAGSNSSSRFGFSVSASDGNYIIAGAYTSDIGNTDLGRAYIYNYANSTWSIQGNLGPTTSTVGEQFGFATYMNSGGNYAYVSAPGDNVTNNDSGAIYVYTRTSNTWSLQQKIKATSLANNQLLGQTIAVNNDDTILAASQRSVSGTGPVQVAVFTRSGNTWSELQIITTPANIFLSSVTFGYSITFDNNNDLYINFSNKLCWYSNVSNIYTLQNVTSFQDNVVGITVDSTCNNIVIGQPNSDLEVLNGGVAYNLIKV